MRRDRTRIARLALLGLVVVVAIAVAWSLKRPQPTRPAVPSGEGGLPETTVGDLVYLSFSEGERKVELRARAMRQDGEAQRLEGVRLTLPFVAEGQSRTAVISADEAVYQEQPRKATFRGHVRVRTDDGFELETDTLKYRSEPNVELRSEDPVAFRRGGSFGTARGMQYREGSGLQLTAEVRLHLEDETGRPTEIESGTASTSREEGYVWFDRGVVVRQEDRELRSQRFHLKLAPDNRTIERAAAIEDVELLTAGGTRRLRCRRLNLVFQAKGVLARASATNPASLELLPAPGEASERRRLTAAVLYFDFDEQGRLRSLASESKGPQGPPGQRRTVLVSEPSSGKGPPRRVESRSLLARFDPVTGGLLAARFRGKVAFSEPGRRAWAEEASFDEAGGLVVLSGGEPRLADEGQGGELRAQEIRVGTRSEAVTARDGVRHTLPRREGAGLGPLGGDEPVVLLCRQFDYDPATKTARYREQALLRSGRDEIRAPLIEIEEPAEGARRLRASGGVASRIHPRPARGNSKPAVPIETRSREMLYDQKAGRVVYSGAVELRQGDILTKSPEAIVLLSADGKSIERLLAGSPVEVRQGARRASGERGTYTPADETLVLVGEKVVVRDADRRLEGRSLTFQVGSDRIRIDGRDEVRTEAVLERKEPPTP